MKNGMFHYFYPFPKMVGLGGPSVVTLIFINLNPPKTSNTSKPYKMVQHCWKKSCTSWGWQVFPLWSHVFFSMPSAWPWGFLNHQQIWFSRWLKHPELPNRLILTDLVTMPRCCSKNMPPWHVPPRERNHVLHVSWGTSQPNSQKQSAVTTSQTVD